MPAIVLALASAMGLYLVWSRKHGASYPSVPGTPTIYIPDSAVYGFDGSFNVQAFLEQKQSALAHISFMPIPSIISQTAATIITNAARQGNVKPQYIITTLQREQGLIEGPGSKNPTQYQLDWACGYGVPDSGIKDLRFQGFEKQVNGAAAAANMARIGSGSYARAGSMVGTVVSTPEGNVIPQSLVAAMMLVYTPHSGALVMTRGIYSRDFPQLLTA